MCGNPRPGLGMVPMSSPPIPLPEFDMMNLKLRRFRAKLGRAKKPPSGLPTQLSSYDIKPVLQLGKGVSKVIYAYSIQYTNGYVPVHCMPGCTRGHLCTETG